MNKTIIALFLVIVPLFAQSQAKKPTIMVVPDDDWCTKNNYMITFENQGVTERVPDYMRALQENSELLGVISKIGGLMAERGFPLEDLKGQLDKIKNDKARTNLSGITESPIDALNKTAKADIIIKMSWIVNAYGPKRSVTFRLTGLDAYTLKQIAEAGDTGPQSFTAELPILLQEAVLSHLDKFNGDLMTHFQDLLDNGREGALVIYVKDGASNNLATSYSFKERQAALKDIINRYWMPRNTVNSRFSMTENSDNVMKFSQVRIPLYGDDGWGGQMAYDFNIWGGNLQQFLKMELKLESDVFTKGLGEVELILK